MVRLEMFLHYMPAIVLSSVLILELCAAGGIDTMIDEHAALPSAQSTVPVPLLPDTRLVLARQVETVLARPLFEPDRRPPMPPMHPETAAPVLPRLSGVIRTPSSATAILQMPDTSTKSVREGGIAGGWTVTQITETTATLASGTVAFVVHTGFAVARPAPVAVPATAGWRQGLRRSAPLGSYLQRHASMDRE